MSNIYYSAPQTTNLNYLANDLPEVFSTLKVGDINNSYVTFLINTYQITDVNNTILTQIGEFYVENRSDLIMLMVTNITEDIMPDTKSLNMSVNGEPVFSRQWAGKATLIQTRRMISGIEKAKPTKGFVARAIAVKTEKNNTRIVMGDVISSSIRKDGTNQNNNRLNVTYYVELPDQVSLLNSYWFIETSYISNNIRAFINGQFIGGPQQGAYTLNNLTTLHHLVPGKNNITSEFYWGGSAPFAGEDGASHFVVEYNTTNDISQSLSMFPLARVSSNCSIEYKKPLFILGDIRLINVNLSVNANYVTLRFNHVNGTSYLISKKNVSGNFVFWTDQEIKNVLEANKIYYANLSGKPFWFNISLDTYKTQEPIAQARRILDNSFVFIDHSEAKALYGFLDINQLVPNPTYQGSIGCEGNLGCFYQNSQWKFNKTNASNALMVFSQFAWLCLDCDDSTTQNISTNGVSLYSHPPNVMLKEITARFGYKSSYIRNGTNTYSLNFSDTYGINATNSLVYYTLLVPNMVSYGATFNSSDAALLDAQARLNQTLGQYVSAADISTDTVSVGGVPSLWGPSTIEVTVWQ